MIERAPGPMTIEEFEPLLARSHIKLELIAGEALAFAGGSLAHGFLSAKIAGLLLGVLRPGCFAFNSDVAIEISRDGTYVFPDASYTCESVNAGQTKIVAPSIVVEVISPESVRRDRVEKLEAYQSVASIQEYVLIDSRRIWVAIYRRAPSMWTETTYREPADIVDVVSVELRFSVADLYRGTDALLTE